MPDHPDIEEALGAIGERDHSITAEYRIFGPPGTGKTTNLTRQIRRAVKRFGKDSVLVTSFSRAAAAELAGQDLPVSSDRVGTLHSHCCTHWAVPKSQKSMWRSGTGRTPICGSLPQRRTESWMGRNPTRISSTSCEAATTGWVS